MTKTVIKTSKWKVNHQVRLSVVLLCSIHKLHLPLGLLKGKVTVNERRKSKGNGFWLKNQEFQKSEIQGKRLLVRKIRNFKKSILEKFRIPL